MNVVLICLDDMPNDIVRLMPYLNSEPQGSWVRFPQARINTPVCGPSRVTHFSGRFASSTGADTNDYVLATAFAGQDEARYAVAQLSRTNRYVAHVGKYVSPGYPWQGTPGAPPNNYTPAGWDDFYCSLGTVFYDWPIVINGVRTTGLTTYETDYSSAKVAELITAAGSRPFVVWWNSIAPHTTGGEWVPKTAYAADPVAPWVRPPNHNETDVSDKPAWLQAIDAKTAATLDGYEQDRANAIRMLRSVDDGLQAIIGALIATGQLENTVLMFWSDNQFLFGEHRVYGKSVPYDEAIRMQLMVRWPGVPGRTDQALVTNADIMPTVLEVCGVQPSIAPDGMSFAALVKGQTTAHRRDLPISQGDEAATPQGRWQGVVSTDGWKYIVHPATSERELYDLTIDPYELTNVAESNPSQRREMARRHAALFPG